MRSLDVRFSGYAKPYKISGDYGERDPPVPIPNTEVKPFSADGTWLETTWESRTLPDSMKKKDLPVRVGLFFSYNQKVLLPNYSNQCAALYLVRIFPAARSAGFRQKKSPGRVGRCRIPQRKASDDVWGFFFVLPVSSFFQVVFKPTSNIVLG